MTPTNEVTKAIIDSITHHGGVAWRNNTGAFAGQYTDKRGTTRKRFVRFGRKGSGDVLALYHGTFLSIEIKTGRDTLRPDQETWRTTVGALS